VLFSFNNTAQTDTTKKTTKDCSVIIGRTQNIRDGFLPCDALLARYFAVGVSVCHSPVNG